MTAEEWRQAESLFLVALELPSANRLVWLQGQCAHDARLLRQVTGMLDADDRAEALPVAAGKQLGTYTLLREIGSGGMGSVHLAHDPGQRRMVAIKRIKPEIRSAATADWFRYEQEILASLDHPLIVRLLDCGGDEESGPYLVMEWVAGVSLEQYSKDPAVGSAAKLEIFRQLCAAVSYCHTRGVVHRDVKPGNVLVTASGEPKLIDFGIARRLRGRRLPSGYAAFTPQYSSPEQRSGKEATERSDVFALGAILRELLPGLARVAAKATRIDPAERYASVAELAFDLLSAGKP